MQFKVVSTVTKGLILPLSNLMFFKLDIFHNLEFSSPAIHWQNRSVYKRNTELAQTW